MYCSFAKKCEKNLHILFKNIILQQNVALEKQNAVLTTLPKNLFGKSEIIFCSRSKKDMTVSDVFGKKTKKKIFVPEYSYENLKSSLKKLPKTFCPVSKNISLGGGHCYQNFQTFQRNIPKNVNLDTQNSI